METFFLSWIVCGWLFGFLFVWYPAVCSNGRLDASDVFGLFLVILCGAVVGPFGLAWYWLCKEP